RLKEILNEESPNAALRIAVDSGGCHGFQYRLELSQEIDASDIVFERDGARVVVDDVSLPLLAGAQVDFAEELVGSAFRIINNPNASTTCGCDISFEIK
ncbi:HesB/YadR/YfhF, partial [Thamnocephalis sphaerospora]